MKSAFLSWLAWLAATLPLAAQAIEPGEVRNFDDVFVISAKAPSRDRVEITWTIAQGYYLYNNHFLSFATDTPGVVLGEPEIPPGEKQFDELLGEEVVKYHQQLTVGLPLTEVPEGTQQIELQVRSQGCLEGVLCYPPTSQALSVNLPAAGAGVSPLEQMIGHPLGGQGQGPLGEAPAGAGPALRADEAFKYEAIGISPETVLARFTVQPGYYLYVDKFAFRVVGSPGVEVREADMPQGTIKEDPEFGSVRVIYDQVEIPVRLNRPAGPEQQIVLEADYQGCRDGDICYPPQTSQVSLLLAAASAPITGKVAKPPPAEAPLSEQGRLARLLVENPAGALAAFWLAGLLLAFTPCVFPMIPILSGLIAGEGRAITVGRALSLSLVYVLAMSLTYTAAGVVAGLFGKNLQAVFQNPWIISSFALVFVLLALSAFDVFEMQMPSRWQTALTERSNRVRGGRLGGVAVMGFLSALIVGPCVAPPLAAALIVIGNSGDPVLGGSALFAMSLGMGVPLLVFGATAGKFLPRAGAWMNAVNAVFGVGLLALAIWMLQRILPDGVTMVLWGLLALGCGVYLGALERLPEGVSGWRKLRKSLGFTLLLAGAIEIVGAAAGGNDWFRPLAPFTGGTSSAHQQEAAFARIKSVADLDRELARAAGTGRPVMLDFYADWCVECKRMERNTFPDPQVRNLLERLRPLQADVTANDAADQALMARFDIIGPPATLFFDRQGREMPAYRLVGYFDPEEFSAHLKQVLEAQ